MIIIPCAVGAVEGKAIMHRLAHVGASSLLSIHPDAAGDYWRGVGVEVVEEVEVEVKPLDNLFMNLGINSIDVLKLDIHGFELEAFRGALGILSKTRYIICEVSFAPTYLGGPLFPELYDWLKKHDFVLSGFFGLPKPLTGRLV